LLATKHTSKFACDEYADKHCINANGRAKASFPPDSKTHYPSAIMVIY